MIILTVCAGVASLVFYSLDRNINPLTSYSKRNLIIRFTSNRERYLEIRSEMETFLTAANAWGMEAFTGSGISYIDYYDTLTEKFAIIFSDSEMQNLQNVQLTKELLIEYTDKLEHQSELLETLYADFYSQKIILANTNS